MIKTEGKLLGIVALWGTSFSLMKPLLGEMGVFQLMAFRFMVGGLVIASLLLLSKKVVWQKGLVSTGLLSGLLLFFTFVGHIAGLKYTSVSKNAFLVGSSVAFVPLILWVLYKERPDRSTQMQTLFALLGLGLITLSGGLSSINRGDLMTLVGTVIFAFYTLGVQRAMVRFDVLTFTAVQLNTVGVLSVLFTLLFENPTFSFSLEGWLSLFALSVVLTGAAYFVSNDVQRKVPATRVALIYTMEPFFATLFGWWALKEAVGLSVLTGGLLLLLSVALPLFARKKKGLKKEWPVHETP